MPDAGDVLNPAVMSAHGKLADIVTEMGVGDRLSIGWWGQFEKGRPDADELGAQLPDLSTDLSWAQFAAMAPAKAERGQGFGQKAEPLLSPDFFPVPTLEPTSKARLADIQRERQSELTEIERRFHGKVSRRSLISDQWARYQQDYKLSDFTGDHYNVHRYAGRVPEFSLWQETILIQGGLGSGKTHQIVRAIAEHLASGLEAGQCVVWVAPTNLLLEQTIARLDAAGIPAMRYQADVAEARFKLVHNHPGVVCMCPDSFKDYSVGQLDWSKKTLVVDEFHSVRSHSLEKSASFPQLARAIREAGFLIAADGFLGNADVEFIENACGRSIPDVRIYQQELAKDATPVRIVQTVSQSGQLTDCYDSIYIETLAKAIAARATAESDLPIYVPSDSLALLRVLQLWLQETHPGLAVKRVSGLDVEANPGFMANPDLGLEGVDVLLGSPSMQSGCDIQRPFFRTVGMFPGRATPQEIHQHIRRVRNVNEIWLIVTSGQWETDTDLKATALDRNVKGILKAFSEAGVTAPVGLQAFGNWQSKIDELNSQFTHELSAAMAMEIYADVQYVLVETPAGATKQYRELRSAVKAEDVTLTFSADRARGHQLLDLSQGPSHDADVWSVDLALLHKKYPALVEEFQSDFEAATDEKTLDALIDLGKLILGDKLTALENQAIAASPDAHEILLAWVERLSASGVATAKSRLYRRYRLVRLYRDLNLGTALVGRGPIGEEDAIVAALFGMFKLANISQHWDALTVGQFWRLAKQAMVTCGHTADVNEKRVQTADLRSNGNFGGKPRYTRSKKAYFHSFKAVKDSGNATYRKHFPRLFEAAKASVEKDLAEIRKWAEKKATANLPPPDVG